jgi:hypothetical protein
MRKLAKMVRINNFQTLEVNERLATIWGRFIERKQLSVSKNSKLHWTLSCPVLFPSPALQWVCIQPAITVKTNHLLSHQRGQNESGVNSNLAEEICHYFTYLVIPWKNNLCGSELSPCENISPETFGEIYERRFLNFPVPRGGWIIVGGNNRLAKEPKRKSLGNEMFIGALESFNIFLECKRPHACQALVVHN